MKHTCTERQYVIIAKLMFMSLFTFCSNYFCVVFQASFTPFLTEHTYQGMRPYIPESMNSGQTESVHYLMIPEARLYFDNNNNCVVIK